jgi:hypothetical protein
VHRLVNVDQSLEDVHTYLLAEFTRIHTTHRQTMAHVPLPRPSSEVIDHLVDKSSGYFVYASTVIKFVDDKNYRPSQRLEIIMGLAEPDSGSPFAALDQLYSQILSTIPPRPRVVQILAVLAAKLGLNPMRIEHLLGLEPGDVRLALRGLHSVIDLPRNERRRGLPAPRLIRRLSQRFHAIRDVLCRWSPAAY